MLGHQELQRIIGKCFEANAVTVAVSFDSNELEGVASVCIQDDGDRICYETIDDAFGAFLASNKNGLSLQLKSKSNKGKGRFSCYAFARGAIWETVVCRGKEKIFYAIKINDESLAGGISGSFFGDYSGRYVFDVSCTES